MSTLFKCCYVLFLYYSATVTLIRNELIMEVSLQPMKRNLFAKSLFDLTTVIYLYPTATNTLKHFKNYFTLKVTHLKIFSRVGEKGHR